MNGATWFLLSLSATQRNHCQGKGLGDDKGEMSPSVLDFILTLRIDLFGVEYVGDAVKGIEREIPQLTMLICSLYYYAVYCRETVHTSIYEVNRG